MDENDAGDDNTILEGFPGSKNYDYGNRKTTIEDLPIHESSPIIPKRRGRPPNSTKRVSNSKSANQTSAEKTWVLGGSLVLSFSSLFFAVRIMNNNKYAMTKQEADSAAAGIIYVLFQYKTIREFAIATRWDSPYAVLIKGFWPYLSRVFVKELIESVISGISPESPTRQSKPKSESNSRKPESVGESISDAGNGNIPINVNVDWRATL